MIKEIKIPYGGGFSYDGGTIVVGDTKAYFLTMTLPNKAETEYTCLAVNQDNGNYSDDCTISADGLTVSVRMVNSMYNTEGSAKIRLVIMDGEKTVTVKEINFAVEAENNTETIATDEPNILNTLADIKNRLIALGLNIVESADSVTTQGVYLIKNGDHHNILLVSKVCDDDIGEQSTDEVTQIMIDGMVHSIYKRFGKRDTGTYIWRDWESIADLSDYYTKAEIDSKISSVYKYKGSVKTYSLLPTSTANTGDVWNVEEQVARTYYGITVNTIQEIGLGMEDEYGEMVIDSTGASYFATGTTYQICTDSKTILGTMTATSISGNTVHFDYHTNDDYYTTFFAMAEECGYSSDQTWETWYEGNSINLNNKVFYFYATEWTPPIEEKTVKVIYEAGTNFAWTGTLWDALGGTVDFSDYYTKDQTDNKLTLKANKSTTLSGYGIADAYTKTEVDSAISAAIETTLNTEV